MAVMAAASPYLMRRGPLALVLGSFFVVALPLAAYVAVASQKGPLAQAYIVLFGVTHFFLTFTVYLSAANRAHFVSSPRNIVAFLGAPLGLLVGFAIFYGLNLPARFALFAAALFTATRGLDFYHLSRQAFGMLQLFKGKNNKVVPAWTRTAENVYFLALALSMFLTYASDLRFDTKWPAAWAALALDAALLAVVVTGHLRARGDKKQTAIALAYLGVQTGSCALAIWRTDFYIASLAVHYVEYHVIMAPRVFRAPLEPGDRALKLAQARPLALYAVLVALGAAWWLLLRAQDVYTTGPSRALVHVFDGIFVFHYVIEMSIWKFSDPYFRKSLGPLYA
jgi:hypothetical protein